MTACFYLNFLSCLADLKAVCVTLLIHISRSAANVLELARAADVVVLAVKPQNVEEMLRTFKSRSALFVAQHTDLACANMPMWPLLLLRCWLPLLLPPHETVWLLLAGRT